MRGLLVSLGLAVAVLGGCDRLRPPGQGAPASAVPIGGAFNLIDVDGKPVTEKTLLGRPTAMFFGFTYCPEVCPTTLAAMTAALKTLGPDADRLNVVFVSVDPERDTPAQMKRYLAAFDPRIQGFTGTPAQVDAAAKAYRVYHRKVPTGDGGYTMDHTATVMLFDRRGRFVEPLSYGFPQEMIVERLRLLVRG